MIQYLQHTLLAYIIYLIVSLPTSVIRKRKVCLSNNNHSIYYQLGLHLYQFSFISIFTLKLLPSIFWKPSDGVWGDLVLLIGRPNFSYSFNPIPLSSFVKYIDFIRNGVSNIWDIFVNISGNILCFIPLGLLPPLLFPEVKRNQTILSGILLSVICEFGQYFIARYSCIDDILLNTLGTILGYQIFYILHVKNHIARRRWVNKSPN